MNGLVLPVTVGFLVRVRKWVAIDKRTRDVIGMDNTLVSFENLGDRLVFAILN